MTSHRPTFRARARRLAALLLAPALLLASLPALAVESAGAPAASATGAVASPSFLIVNPSGRGNQSMAQGFLGDFGAALDAGWPAAAPRAHFAGRYHVTEADALASLRRQRPDFALVSPGFYLAHRDDLGLVPLLQPIRDHDGPAVVHVVVAESRRAAPLGTMRLGGQLAGEPAWVLGPVLGLPAGAKPTLRPSERTLEAIRRLAAGELDGVLLADADWALLKRTGKSAGLALAFTSGPLPEGPVVSFGPPNPRVLAAVQALLGFAGTEPGRKVLARMTLRGFREASASDYAPFAAAHDAKLREMTR